MQTKTQPCPIALRWPLANETTGHVYDSQVNTNDLCYWLAERRPGLAGMWFTHATHINLSQPRPDLN